MLLPRLRVIYTCWLARCLPAGVGRPNAARQSAAIASSSTKAPRMLPVGIPRAVSPATAGADF